MANRQINFFEGSWRCLTLGIYCMVFTVACRSETSTVRNKTQGKSFSEGLPQNYADQINANYRDYVREGGYPIANILAIEILLDSQDIKKGENARVTLRCIVEREDSERFLPRLESADFQAEVDRIENVGSFERFDEVELIYYVDLDFLTSGEKIMVAFNKKTNTILSGSEVIYLSQQVDIVKNSENKGMLTISVDL